MFLYCVGLLLASQGYLIKRTPSWLKKIKFYQLLIWMVVILVLSILVSPWTVFGPWLIATMTVLTSSCVIYKFQEKYEEMERGM